MADANLTVTRLREVLDYDPGTGNFAWKKAIGRRIRVGAKAGNSAPGNRGYVLIRVDGGAYRAHRLAWMYVFGEWPDGEVDHLNGCRSDNRICNLRVGSHALNAQNRRHATRRSKSGLLGAHWRAREQRWVARLKVGGECFEFGYYLTPEEAHAAYLEGKRRLHPGCTI